MAETKIEIRRRGGYTILPNEVLQDPQLNLQTKGLFCLMLSLSDNWDYSVRGLAKFAGCGRDKIRSALENLEEAGYLIREQSHKNGKFAGNVYVLQDWKSSPLPGFPATEKPAAENPLPKNPTQRNKQIKKETNKPPIIPHDVAKRLREYMGSDRELGMAIYGLLEMRHAIKKPVKTVRTLEGILKKLDNLSEGDRSVKLALLDKATTSNYLTVYPLKPDELPRTQQRPQTVELQKGDYML